MIKTTEQIISNFINTHGNKYDYSKVRYTGCNKFVTIVCKTHGEFSQRARAHHAGQGCAKCTQSNNWKPNEKTKEEFLERANKTHKFKYDFIDMLKIWKPNCYNHWTTRHSQNTLGTSFIYYN